MEFSQFEAELYKLAITGMLRPQTAGPVKPNPNFIVSSLTRERKGEGRKKKGGLRREGGEQGKKEGRRKGRKDE